MERFFGIEQFSGAGDTTLDQQCDKLLQGNQSYVYRTNITAYVVIAIIGVVYTAAAFYFYT